MTTLTNRAIGIVCLIWGGMAAYADQTAIDVMANDSALGLSVMANTTAGDGLDVGAGDGAGPINTADMYALMALLQNAPRPVDAVDQRPKIGVIFDGSRSMLGRMDGSLRKSEITAEAFSTVMPILTQYADVNVVRFGGEMQGSCRPVNAHSTNGEIWSPSSATLASWQANSASPSHQGSPVWASLRKAAEAEVNNIVLISDGKGECADDQNICENVRQFNTYGIKVHVLAVTPPSADIELLSCISRNTGGVFANARSPRDVGVLLGILTRLASADSQSQALLSQLEKLSEQLKEHDNNALENFRNLMNQAIDANKQLADIASSFDKHEHQILNANSVIAVINQLNIDVTRLEQEVVDLKVKLAERDGRIAELMTENGLLSARIEDLETTIDDKDASIAALHVELEAAAVENARLLKVIAELEAEKAAAIEAKKALEARIAGLQGEIERLEAELQGLKDSIAAQTSSFGETIRRAEQDCKVSINLHIEQSTAPLLAEIDHLKSSLDQCRADASDTIEKLHAQLAIKQETIDELTLRIGEKNTQITELEARLEQKDAEIARIQIDLDEQIERNVALNDTLVDLRGQIKPLEERILVLEGENQSLFVEAEHCEALVTDLTMRIESYDDTVEKLHGAIKDCQNEKEQISLRLQSANVRISQLEGRVEVLNQEIEKTNALNLALGKSLHETQMALEEANTDAHLKNGTIEVMQQKLWLQAEYIKGMKSILGNVQGCVLSDVSEGLSVEELEACRLDPELTPHD